MKEFIYTFYHNNSIRMQKREQDDCIRWITEHNSLAFQNLYEYHNKKDPKFNPEGKVYFPDTIDVYQDGKLIKKIPVTNPRNFKKINKVICESGGS